MSEENEKNLPPEHSPQPVVDRPTAADPVPAAHQPAPAGPRFRDRVLGMRAVAAVAVASVILGGVGGAALGAVSAGGGEGDRGGFGRDGQNGPGQLPGGPQLQPGGVSGQLPPGATRDQDDGGPDADPNG